ncbi:NADPH-dependent F420 reductase [Streptomyces coelicoflavus]|uniref:NADPH-dependent F420 reductase n=1 Tax=Streptomyces TaxID=1883 RepID=UPI0031F650CD
MSGISIVGVGNMARALAARALAGGNAVEIIGRDRVKAEELAGTLDGATVGTAGAAPAGDIVILAAPYAGAAEVVREYGDALRGRIIVDITNPVAPDLQGLVVPDDSSGAQEIAGLAPEGAHVVKAFNTVFSHVLAAGPAEGRPLDVFVAGDDAQAKARVSAFVAGMGLRPWDIGGLAMARALENVALVELGLMNHSVKHTDFSLGITLLH